MTTNRQHFFWLLLISILIILTLIISLLPWFLELLATPTGRVFSGINRWSGDYYTYLSYVELGKRGEILARLLATTEMQQPVFTHLAHTLAGFVFGKLMGFNSVFSYHLARAFYGLVFIFLTFVFFYRLSKNKTITLLSLIFTFYISGLPQIISLSPLSLARPLSWFQEQNIIGRATGPLHYSMGFIFFILCFLWYFSYEKNILKKIIVFGLLLNFLLIANPFAFLIFSLSFGLYFILKIIINLKKLSVLKSDFFVACGGFLMAIPLFIYNQIFLSQEPWGRLGVAPKYYIVTHPPIQFFEAIMSIGPIFFLGIVGIIIFIYQKLMGVEILGSRPAAPKLQRGEQRAEFFQPASTAKRGEPAADSSTGGKKIETGPVSKSYVIFLISWLTIQFFLFFFGDYVKLDPIRSFNGLYYLPLALFSSYTVVFFSEKIHGFLRVNKHTIMIVTLILLFLITLPVYLISFKEHLYAFTDFKNFTTFSYPTVKQVQAFHWLEKNTPVGSGVLALYEASFLMIGISGNSTGANMDHNQKAPFYYGNLSDENAYQFLKNNRFQYVYYGYQEKSIGGSIEKYTFLKKIFENEEVIIYKVHEYNK